MSIESSSTDTLCASAVGASLTAVTVIVKVCGGAGVDAAVGGAAVVGDLDA